MDPKESDWKLFRQRVPEWRERYLAKKNSEIVAMLIDPAKTPTERFWDAKEQMGKQAKILVSCLDGHSRSTMTMYLYLMYGHGLVVDADLAEFSEALRNQIITVSRM